MRMTEKQKEETILHYMKSLSIDRLEAELLLDFDLTDVATEESEKEIQEKTEKAKKNGRHYEKAKVTKEKTSKERKVDNEKGFLLGLLAELLENNGADITERKTETEIKFIYNDNNYTFKLTKHKKK